MNSCRGVEMVLLLSMLGGSAPAEERVKAQGAGRQYPVAHSDNRQSERAQPATADSIYVIGPEDVLDIRVWKEADFSRSVPVRPDGRISLPLLNDIQAAGLTPMQLAASLAVTLRKYVTDPQVTVIVTQVNSWRVYVLGEVNRPGPVSLLPGMTVLQGLASAGGFTQFANQKNIYVLRNEGGKQVRYPFNYKEAIRGKALKQNFTLRPGDTVVVP